MTAKHRSWIYLTVLCEQKCSDAHGTWKKRNSIWKRVNCCLKIYRCMVEFWCFTDGSDCLLRIFWKVLNRERNGALISSIRAPNFASDMCTKKSRFVSISTKLDSRINIYLNCREKPFSFWTTTMWHSDHLTTDETTTWDLCIINEYWRFCSWTKRNNNWHCSRKICGKKETEQIKKLMTTALCFKSFWFTNSVSLVICKPFEISVRRKTEKHILNMFYFRIQT